MLQTSERKFPSQTDDTIPIKVLDVVRNIRKIVLSVVIGIEDSDIFILTNKSSTFTQPYTRNKFVILKVKLLSLEVNSPILLKKFECEKQLHLIREVQSKVVDDIKNIYSDIIGPSSLSGLRRNANRL